MKLAHRNYFQLSVVSRQAPRAPAGAACDDSPEALAVARLPEALDRRVSDLDELLDSLRLITPLLNALQGVVFFVKNRNARYVLANLTLARRCGYDTVAPLLGKTCTEVFPRHMGPAYSRQDRRVLASGVPLFDKLELHLFHGRAAGWCLTHKLPIRDPAGNVLGLAGISHDLPAGDAAHPAYEKIAAVDRHIARHFGRHITLRELTGVAGLSVAQLERHCKRVYQLTPRQLIHKQRFDHASMLLAAQDLPITEVALQCGYSDHSAFSRQFKSVTGMTPQQFRRAIPVLR